MSRLVDSLRAAAFFALITRVAPAAGQSSAQQEVRARQAAVQTAIANEHRLWEATRHRDTVAIRALLADDTYAIDNDGRVLTKREQVALAPRQTISTIEMSEPAAIALSADAVVLHYRLRMTGSFEGKPFSGRWNWVTSVWARRDGKWQCVVYQETLIES